MTESSYLSLSTEVEKALSGGLPVVALESTVISHGMPYPENYQTALQTEQIIREKGVVPATVALMDGKIKIGLTKEEIEVFARESKKAYKTSRRDIPYVLLKKLPGATTVSATMIAASLAGIRVFATGGIGGVHRNAAETWDISADLSELSVTPVAVVCAGIKSILDLPKTMEYLETAGVPVIGYRTDELPAFFTRHSGIPVNYRLDSAEEIARFLAIKKENGLEGGAVIANPVPLPYEANGAMIEKAIAKALDEAKRQGVSGKEITPFVLSRIAEITGGKSLEANIRLLWNNAGLATEIALHLSR